MTGLKIGQVLYGRNKNTQIVEEVTISNINNDEISVLYKGKEYKTNTSYINEKLFPEKYQLYSCDDCKLKRREECFGKNNTCSEFIYTPPIDEKESENGSQYGKGTDLRTYELKREF